MAHQHFHLSPRADNPALDKIDHAQDYSRLGFCYFCSFGIGFRGTGNEKLRNLNTERPQLDLTTDSAEFIQEGRESRSTTPN